MKSRAGSLGFGGLVPMLDILFLLLFALLALSDVRTSNRLEPVRIQLPRVEPGPGGSVGNERRVVIEVDHRSRIFLQPAGVPIASGDVLDRELAQELGDALPEEVVVEIQADRDARYGVAVELLQHLRNRGFVRVQLVAVGSEDDSGVLGGGR